MIRGHSCLQASRFPQPAPFIRSAPFLPLPATQEWGEDRAEGKAHKSTLLSPALSSIRWRRGSPFGCGQAALSPFAVLVRAHSMETAEIPLKPRPRLPEWLRIKLPTSDTFARTRALLNELKLHTVCESAKCPNHWECWSKGTATFMIAGDRCTRACGFCAVATAKPFALEADEPARVAEATRRMGLNHVVITAVARDDLPDGGAEHFRRTIEAVRALNHGIVVEVLVPDFNDRDASIETVLSARP